MAPASDGRGSADNVISKLSQLADSHLYIVRLTKFSNAKDIPEWFIKKNVKLRGKVICVKENAVEIDHVPISVPILSPLQKKWYGQGSLLVRLAGVEITPSGKLWLQNNLQPSQRLWFQLLNRDDSRLDCFIFVNRGGFFNTCLNTMLLREGLGRAAAIAGVQEEAGQYWKFYKRLLQAEVQAQKARKGLWQQESRMNALTDKILGGSTVQKIKSFANSVVRFWKKFRT
ncbi:protein C3orf33 homolog isoform X2 [Hyperolius riggenbachi]|uniref:protein C3orf33 homolog isoform X2 n=1 Tax=Hyperolius riggenbachi TaxID=752182 RepID=UPI0035A2E58A